MFLFSKDALNLSKVTVNTFIVLQKKSISSKCRSFEFYIHQRIMKKIITDFTKNIKQQNGF